VLSRNCDSVFATDEPELPLTVISPRTGSRFDVNLIIKIMWQKRAYLGHALFLYLLFMPTLVCGYLFVKESTNNNPPEDVNMDRLLSLLICIPLLIFMLQKSNGAQPQQKTGENTNARTESGAPEGAAGPNNESVAKQDQKKHSTKKNHEIIITATKTGINKRETGASITVITSEEMEHREIMNVVEMLKDTPGVSVSQSSPLGGVADLYMRGTNSNHIVVLIDGVRVNNPASIGNGFDFADLTTDNIDRIEIIRGSQSTLYGSDAIGGVINIITKKGKGRPTVAIKAEGGSYATFKESVASNGGNEWAYYSFGVSRTDSAGFSRTSTWRGVRRSFIRDGHDWFNNNSVSLLTGIRTIHDGWLSLGLRYTDASMKIVNGAFEEDKNHTYDNENLAFNLTYNIPLFDWWEADLVFSYMNQYLRDKDLPDLYEFLTSDILSSGFGYFNYTNMSFRGKIFSGEFKNKFRINDIDEIICGVSYEKQYAATLPYWFIWNQFFAMGMQPTEPIDKSSGTWAAYAQNHLKLFKRIFIITGARYTDPDHFSHKLDYSASGSIILPVTETRLKANVGTGYKIPSLYQLYNQFGRYVQYTYLYLRPERTLSYDAGFEQPLWKKKIVIEANYFSIDYKKMIVYDNTTVDPNGRYWNARALARGVECILSFSPVEGLAVGAYYTFTRTHDKTFHNGDLVRRPRHQAGVAINYAFLKKGNLNLSFTYVGRRKDYWRFPFVSYMNPYYRLDAAASWWVIDHVQVFVRAENLLNKKYDEVRGYRTQMLSLYGGFKAVL
jgi:vitamin B12 transporter